MYERNLKHTNRWIKYFSVAPLTDAESAKYDNIDFDPEEYRKDIGAPGSLRYVAPPPSQPTQP